MRFYWIVLLCNSGWRSGLSKDAWGHRSPSLPTRYLNRIWKASITGVVSNGNRKWWLRRGCAGRKAKRPFRAIGGDDRRPERRQKQADVRLHEPYNEAGRIMVGESRCAPVDDY